MSKRLFERSRTGAVLTDAGRQLREGVVQGLGILQATVDDTAGMSDTQVVITCTHEISTLFLLPRFDALQRALGEEISVRVRTCTPQFEVSKPGLHLTPDVILSWGERVVTEDCVMVFEETVRPICSPGYAVAHASTLKGPVSGWYELSFLDDLTPDRGWASWEDWFRSAGRPAREPRYIGFDSYVYILEAAAAGRGIALGWRFLIEKYLAAGTLVEIGDDYVLFRSGCQARLTEQGRYKPLARKCLEFFDPST